MSSMFRFVRVAMGGVSLFYLALTASAQTPGQQTPCGIAIGGDPRFTSQGLIPVAGGLVYDSNQGVCWLAHANLAGDPAALALLKPLLSPANPDPDGDGVTLPVINPDGTMNYETALNWVNALNQFNGGKGWLNHNNWQLPTTTPVDTNCSSQHNGNFGVLCKNSALANLYNYGLARAYPDSVVPYFFDLAWPFFNLQPGLYWSRSPEADSGSPDGGGGYSTFSFNTGDKGSNTINYNFFHVLPVTKDVLGTVPAGPGIVRPYISGPGAGKAVLDTNTQLSWTLNANLAAIDNFGFTDTVVLDTVPGDPDVNHTAFPMSLPIIDKDGAIHFSGLCAHANNQDPCPTPSSGWIVSMNDQEFAGSANWKLPRIDDLVTLNTDLGLPVGDPRLESQSFVGPFWRLQPGFYWSCPRDSDTTNNQAPCDLGTHPGFAPGSNTPMQYSFNFDDGFLGTDKFDKLFYVMVYFPAPSQ